MAETLPETLKGLVQIRHFPFEIIIVDDGSTDSTQKIIRRWQNDLADSSNIEFQSIHQSNRGRAGALNEGAKIAKGEYLSFVDADDIINPDELIKLWECMRAAKKKLVLGQFRFVTEGGKEISNRALNKDLTSEKLIRKLAYSLFSPVHLNAFLIKRDYFLDQNGMDSRILKSQDKDLLIRLLRNTDSLVVCNSCHYIYRKHNLSRSELVNKRFEWFFYRQQVIWKNFSGFTKIASMGAQAFYDLVKLFYEVLFRYRV